MGERQAQSAWVLWRAGLWGCAPTGPLTPALVARKCFYSTLSNPVRPQLMPRLCRQHTVWLRSVGRFVQGHTAADPGLWFILPQTNPLPLLAWPDRDGGSGTWCVRGQSEGSGGAAHPPLAWQQAVLAIAEQ